MLIRYNNSRLKWFAPYRRYHRHKSTKIIVGHTVAHYTLGFVHNQHWEEQNSLTAPQLYCYSIYELYKRQACNNNKHHTNKTYQILLHWLCFRHLYLAYWLITLLRMASYIVHFKRQWKLLSACSVPWWRLVIKWLKHQCTFYFGFGCEHLPVRFFKIIHIRYWFHNHAIVSKPFSSKFLLIKNDMIKSTKITIFWNDSWFSSKIFVAHYWATAH